MARKNKKNGTSNLGTYVVMGAGFAIGAATVSVIITGATMLANEGIKMLKASKTNGGALPANGQTGQYGLPPGQPQQQQAARNAYTGQ